MKPRSKTTQQIEARRKSAIAQGRTEGLKDALFLLGVGLGVGIASALSPKKPGKCQKRSLVFGACRLDANHDGDCDFERLLR